METAETRGKVGSGRIEALGNSGGFKVGVLPGSNSGVPAHSFLNPWSGFDFSVSPKLDLGFRVQWGAPFLLRAKYQFAGTDEEKREIGTWSAALIPSLGVGIGSFGVPDFTATYSQYGLGFVVSYRISQTWVAGPQLNYQSLSFSGDGVSLSGSVLGYGLHAQWEDEDLFIRFEPAKQVANIGGGSKSHYAFGLLGGIRF